MYLGMDFLTEAMVKQLQIMAEEQTADIDSWLQGLQGQLKTVITTVEKTYESQCESKIEQAEKALHDVHENTRAVQQGTLNVVYSKINKIRNNNEKLYEMLKSMQEQVHKTQALQQILVNPA